VEQKRHTFSEICDLESRLTELCGAISRIINAGGNHTDFWQQWLVVKQRAMRLVGWDAIHPQDCE